MEKQLVPGLPNEIALQCILRVPYKFLSEAASVCKDWKTEIVPPEFLRLRKAAGFSDPIIVMSQARANRYPSSQQYPTYWTKPDYGLSLFEPKTGKWVELPLMISGNPTALPRFCQLVGVGSDLIVMGGWDPVTWDVSTAVYVYNFVSAKWRRGADMPGVKRLSFGCTSDGNGMVFVVGGCDSEKNALRSAMAYDVAKNEWIDMADMARERDECKAVFHRGNLLVIGGCTEVRGEFQTSAETFDVATSKWDPIKEDFLPSRVSPLSCVAGHDGKLYMSWENQVVEWDNDIWRVVAEMPPEGSDANRSYVTTWQDKLFVIGFLPCEPYKGYVLDLHSYKWTRVEVPGGRRRDIEAGCYMEI